MYYIYDAEYDLMSYCLNKKSKWWANHFFRNKEVDKLYSQLRKLSLSEIGKIIGELE